MWLDGIWTNLMSAAQECPVTVAAVLLLVVGAGAVLTVVIRERKFSLRSVGSLLSNLLWASPAIAVLAFVAVRVMPLLHTTQAAPAESGSAGMPWDDDSAWTVKPVGEWPTLEGRELAEWNPDVALFKAPDLHDGLVTHGDASPGDSAYRVVLESEQHSRVEAAREELTELAAALVEEDFTRNNPEAAGWQPSGELVRSKAVVAEHVEKIEHELPSGPTFEMNQVRWVVELSPQVRESFASQWRPEVASGRMELIAGLMALLTLVFATLAVYFRFDMRTAGRYHKRLKVAAVSVVVASGLGYLQLIQTLHG
jgi:hypothetical protein